MLRFRALFVAIFILTFNELIAFNIETRHYTQYTKESKSMFGFSVAEYRDKNRRGWVIVGAPEAQTAQPNVYRGGGVYKCDIAADDLCTPIEFDQKENNYVKNPHPPFNLIQIDNKTLQWFGATVSTSLEDGGPIMACAPRYVFFSVSQSKKDSSDSSRSSVGNRRDPVGTCWVTNLTTSTEVSPCRTRNFGYHRQGSCQAGLGAALSKDGERLFIGAPGSWYWQGQLYSIMRRLDNFPFVPPGNHSFGVFQGQTYTQLVNNRGKVMFTKEGSPEEDDSYLGYSVISGDFIGNGDIGTAVGMPRGFGLHGKVVLLTSNMTNHQNITGEQMGGYFGYSLACADVDGDGLDDLIVGAPMYTIPENPEMYIETGRIYIFYGKGPDKYRQVVTRDGESNRGRFGLSLAALGDIDRDGYGDFAVGAPYGGLQGRGAVYIYHGSRDGVVAKYSQVIHGEEVNSNVVTFGFSISGGLDLDNNHYPDMVVGSYESATAMFFRSKPVIKMVPLDTYVEFASATKLISLDDKNCTLSDTTQVTCLPLKACFKYTGDGVSDTYDFNVQYVLDVKKTKSPRLFFLEYEGKNTLNRTINVNRNEQFCRTIMVYITPSIRDKLTSLDAEMRMGLAEDKYFINKIRDPRLPLRPVLATTSSRKDTLSIRKNCGIDNICTPNLQLNVTSEVEKYLLGSGKRLIFEVFVKNINEDAFESTYNLKLPPGVDYIKIERIDKTEIPVQCSAPKQSNNNTLKCDIGNPLPKDNIVRFNVLLQPVDVHDEKSSYEFEMNVNSTNSELESTKHDNFQHISLEIWVDTELRIEGESKPKDLYYNPDNYTIVNATSDVEFGPAFIHNYTIRNLGPSRIEEAEVYLIWPAATLARDDLVYLLEQPETSGPLVCETANANPLSLKLEQRRKQYPNYPTSRIVHEHLIGTKKSLNVHTGYEYSTERSSTENHNLWKESKSNSWNNENTFRRNGEVLNEKGSRVLVHTESVGGSSLGVGDATLGRDYHSKDENLLRTTELPGSWQESHQFHETNKTNRYGSSSSNVAVDDSYRHTGGTSVNFRHEDAKYDDDQLEKESRLREHQRFLQEKRIEEDRLRIKEQELIAQRRHEDEAELRRQQIAQKEEFENQKRYKQISGEFHQPSHSQEESSQSSNFAHRLQNISSSYDLDRFLSSLKDSIGFEFYHRHGSRFLQFLARFRVAEDGREYLEFKDGSMFPLLNRFSEQSYASRAANDLRYLKFEGEIVEGEDGKMYCKLKDDRRFPLQSSWSFSEEKTYTIGDDGTESSYDDGQGTTYGSRWSQESINRENSGNREVETYEKRIHEERKVTQRKHEAKVYDGPQNYEDQRYRHKRMSDAMTVEDLKRLEAGHKRLKRSSDSYLDDDVNTEPSDFDVDETREEKVLPLCEAARCVTLHCTLGRLEKDEEVSISARFRIKGITLKKIALDSPVKISTQLVASVTKLPFIGKPAGEIVKNHEVFTNVEPTARLPEPDVVPLWVVVLSACAGTIILLLLIFLLYKCGFFKRNRPTDAPERQPLNRNGHYQHGDDHQ